MAAAFSAKCLLALCAQYLISPTAFAQSSRRPPEPTVKVEAPEPAAVIEEKNDTEINVKNADIAAVIRIFSKKTKRNYILDERVKGKVSIYLPAKVTPEESLKILDAVLGLKGFTTVPLSDNLWKVVPTKEAKQSTIPTLREGDPDLRSGSVVTRIIQLKYVGADEVKEVVSQLASPDGLVSAYAGTNALLLIDYEDNAKRIADIIGTVDVPFSNREMTIIPVKHADVEDIQKKLADILGLAEGNDKKDSAASFANNLDIVRARAREMTLNAGQPVSAQAVGSEGGGSNTSTIGRAKEPKIIADDRTNSIIVVADDETTARVRALISQLDSEIDLSGDRFYVYHCQHASADELVEVLSGLMGGGGGEGKTTGSNLLGDGNDINTNSRNRGDKANRTQDRNSRQQRTPGRSRGENKSDSSGATGAQLGEDISVTADKATNSLIIHAGKTDYEKIKSLLEQLDIKRRQVLVEAMILEVGVDDSLQLGADILGSVGNDNGGVLVKSDFGSPDQSLANLLKSPLEVSRFSVAAASAGTLTLPGGIKIPTQSVLVSAAQQNSNVNVLSSPNLLTTDNEEAEIVVGQNVPFLASQSTSDTNLNNTFNQIDRQDVGITLRLTPQISSQSFVKLQIFTEVSNVIAVTDLGPTTTVRTSETTVIAKDGQMVVIGGLLSDSSNDSDAGVPFLKDIPILGYAFRDENARRQKTNLLIFITPRIVQDQFTHRDLTVEQREEMEAEIESRDVHPNRQDILENPHIDKVTEAKMYEGTKPSTILPPEGASPKSDAPTISHRLPTDSPGAIEFKIKPKLPEQRGMLSPSKLLPPKGPTKFHVVEVVHPKRGLSLPFSWDTRTNTFGLEVPADSAPSVFGYFQTGRGYTYKINTDEVPLSVIGSFSSKEDAEKFFEDRKLSWYTLSPYEVMGLGKDQWTKR